LAENSRTFTSIFDLVDRFTAPYDAIQKKMNAITDKIHQVDIEFNESKAGQALDNIQKKVNDTTSTTNSWNNALGRAAGVADKTASSTQKIGNEAQKTTGFLGSMQSKLENVGGVADKLRDKFGAITGLLAGGSIGGMSWLNAMSSDKSAASFERRMARKGIDTKSIDEFIAKAEGAGYTTTGTRRDIADTLLTRTNLRGAKMESTTKSIEDLYFQNSYDLNKNGITSARDFSDLLTKKTLGPGDRQALIDIGFMNKNAKTMSVSNRLKAAQKQGAGIDETTLAAQDPYQAFLNRLSETSEKVGKTMVEPMNMVLGKVNDLLDLINNIPGAPGLIALVAVLMAVAGGASLVLTILSPLLPLFTALKVAMLGQAAANQALAASEVEVGAASGIMGAGIWTALAPIILIGAPLLALGAALYLVEQKTHIFGKAFKQLGKTEMAHDLLDFFKDMGYWIREGIKWVDTLYKMLKTTGLSKVVLGAAFGPIGLGLGAASMLSGKDPSELLGWIIDQDKNILRWIVTTFPFFARIHEILKKVHSIFEWLYSLISGMVSFLKDALGITREQKKSTWEKAMDASGVKWQNGKYVQNTAGREGWEITNPETSVSNYKHLEKLRGKYEEAPAGLAGLADGIAKAVKEGLSGLKIDGIEGIQELIDSIQTLVDKLGMGDSSPNTGLGGIQYGKVNSAYDGNKQYFYTPGSKQEYEVIDWEDTIHLGRRNTITVDEVPDEVLKSLKKQAGYASGATFTRNGLFAGKVHSPEEIIPQAIASRGPGPISRALRVLDSVMSGQASAVGGTGEVHNHYHMVPHKYDFSGMKISSDLDVEKLIKRIVKESTEASNKAARDKIGLRRT